MENFTYLREIVLNANILVWQLIHCWGEGAFGETQTDHVKNGEANMAVVSFVIKQALIMLKLSELANWKLAKWSRLKI